MHQVSIEVSCGVTRSETTGLTCCGLAESLVGSIEP